MKKNFRQIQSFLAGLILSIFLLPASYGQDLIISEVFANPSGSDSPFEFVEFIATKTINFGTTPYCVVWANNGTATSNGWISGSSLSYGFSITSGTVNKGDVVYVGGSSMIPTGTKLRTINTGTTAGDQFGSANASGVCGNGGSNADAVAVFNVPIASLTSGTAPIDAIFYGTGIGTALVSGGTAGYQLPVNDLYNGGKLQSNSFYAPDPSSAQYLVATGTYDTLLNAFTTARTWSNTATFTDNSSSVSLTAAAPGTIAFAQTHSIFQESAGTTSFQLSMSNPNSVQASATVEVVAYGTATGEGTDYTFSTQTIIFPANTGGTSNVTITIEEDALSEAAEYIYFRLIDPVNATLGLSSYILYIKDNDNMAPAPSNELSLQLLGSYSNGASGTNSSEISDYDSISHRIFIANSIGAKLDIIDISNPSQITPVTSVSIAPYGNINSVAVKNGIVAAAVENSSPQSPGKVVFFDTDGNYLAEVTVGAMPDMVTFNHAGTKVYTTNEGEPNSAYTSDPDGSISVIDISGGVGAATVATIDFTAYNGQEAALRAQGIRIYGLNATASQDFEPEYITISEDDQTAWVNLQENNAVAVLNLADNTISQLMPLGYKDLSLTNNSLDASDLTSGVVMANWPVKGMYLPDELGSFTVSGTPYLIMANEGDSRAYNGFSEETSLGSGSYILDTMAFPQAAYLKSNFAAGKLKVTNKLGDTDNDGDFDEIYAYGGRSFSVVNGTTGALVYDSGDDIEQITANDPVFSAIFNANNSASNTAKNRSDDKGPEPEGVAVSEINGSIYAFIGLERIGGVMVFNVNDPANPQFVTYGNNRSVVTSAPDRGTEGIKVISAAASPTGQALVILSNEVSSTLTVYALCGSGGSLQTYYADADGDTYGNLTQTTQACDTPAGYVADNTDCDDAVAAINPGATEICNTIDDDCDNMIDEDGQNVFYADNDADGYGDLTSSTLACVAPVGYVTDSTDCDDALAAVNPGATEICNTIDDDCDNTIDEGGENTFYADVDLDGYGDPSSTTQACTAPMGYVADNTDCDDAAIEVNPGEMESCNGIDDDCDNLVDEGVQATFYADTDGDSYGDLNSTVIACMAPSGFVSDSTDCNDAVAAVNPGATEICNTIDDDCDNLVDEEGLNTYYADADGDGYGDATNTTTGCTAPSGFVADNTDCNDANAAVNPGTTEICNNTDDDCDNLVDEGVQTTFYADADNDGYGDLSSTTLACTAPEGYVANSTDCNDGNAAVNPGATEICNTIDDDCDNLVDEGVQNTFYADADNDGYGDILSTTLACTAPSGYVADNTDCNDAAAAVNPGAAEVCNETDDDCDMQIDEGVATTTYYQDADGDGKGNPLVSVVACAQPNGYVSNNTDCDDNTVVACPMPTATATTDITDVSAVLSWTGTNCASRYRLEYRQKTTPASPWIVVYVTESSYELTGLLEGTNYQWRVGTVCTPGGTSVPAGFTVQLQFKTKYRVYPDVDNDGYGDSNSETVLVNTFPAIGYSTDNTDCDDAVFTTHPNATELCNGVDDDCDGTVDDGIVNAPLWYQDADGDGLGNELVTLNACIQPDGYVSNSKDCDDNNIILVCAPPTNGLVVNLSATSATLSWSVVPCALRYTLQYRRILPTGAWSTKVNVDDTTTTLTGLMPNTTYQLRVRSLCPSPNPTTSDWLTITFTTPALPMGLTEDIATTDLIMANPEDMQLAVYPNPGDGRFNISLYTEQEEQEVNIMISDGFGKLVYTTKWSVFEGQNIDQLDLSFLSGGVYQVTVQQGEIIQTKKVVILR